MFLPLTEEVELTPGGCFAVKENVDLIAFKNGRFRCLAVENKNFSFVPNKIIPPDMKNATNLNNFLPNQSDQYTVVRQYFRSSSNWHYSIRPKGYYYFSLPEFHIGKGAIYYGAVIWCK